MLCFLLKNKYWDLKLRLNILKWELHFQKIPLIHFPIQKDKLVLGIEFLDYKVNLKLSNRLTFTY